MQMLDGCTATIYYFPYRVSLKFDMNYLKCTFPINPRPVLVGWLACRVIISKIGISLVNIIFKAVIFYFQNARVFIEGITEVLQGLDVEILQQNK